VRQSDTYLRWAGAALFVGGAWSIISIQLAEALTPNYDLANGSVSGLGSTFFANLACSAQPCNTIRQPASVIIIASWIVSGLCFLASAYLIKRARPYKWLGFNIGSVALGLLLARPFIGSSITPRCDSIPLIAPLTVTLRNDPRCSTNSINSLLHTHPASRCAYWRRLADNGDSILCVGVRDCYGCRDRR
jgi:hypothetical protein